MGLTGKKAPNFTTSAVINGNQIVDDFSLSNYEGKYVLFFFYPLILHLFAQLNCMHSKKK